MKNYYQSWLQIGTTNLHLFEATTQVNDGNERIADYNIFMTVDLKEMTKFDFKKCNVLMIFIQNQPD